MRAQLTDPGGKTDGCTGQILTIFFKNKIDPRDKALVVSSSRNGMALEWEVCGC